MHAEHTIAQAAPGDWVQVHGRFGQPPRRGQIEEILGAPGHEHFRVRWDEQHESILYPADGVTIVPPQPRPHARRGAKA